MTDRGGNTDSSNQSDQHAVPSKNNIVIHPGLVEEAVHRIDYQGGIDLSELRFSVDESLSSTNDSALDIAIFQVPTHCNSQKCDLSQYGVGSLESYNGAEYLSLCGNDGRLQINADTFRGHHMELPVPGKGDMPLDRIMDGAKIIASEKDRVYEVMLANCNRGGRAVTLEGQVVFESFGKSALHAQDDVSGLHLILMAAAVFLLFTICSFRIHMGTRADYAYSRLLPIFDASRGASDVEHVVRRTQQQQPTPESPSAVLSEENSGGVTSLASFDPAQVL